MANDFNLDQVLDNQQNKETTINTAVGQLAEAIGNFLSIDLTSANKTLTQAEGTRYVNYRRTDTTASRTITVRQMQRFFIYENSNVSTSLIRGATTIVIAANEKALLYSDGTTNGLVKVLSSVAPAVTDIPTFLQMSGDITPTQLTANQNDWNPTDLATSVVIRASTDASRDLTGLAGGSDGRIIMLMNIGGFNLVLKNASASSSDSNRFLLGGADVTLAPDQAAFLMYDSTSSRWRLIGGTGGGGGSTTFLALTDTPDSYSGQAFKFVRVNSGATALEFFENKYPLVVFVPGVMTNGQLVFQYIADENIRIPSGASGSVAKAGVASTGNVNLDIKKNGSDSGDITFNVSATGSFTVGSNIDLVSGDLLQITGPVTADATLADVSINIRAQRY